MDILFREPKVLVTDGAVHGANPDSRHMSNTVIYQVSLRFENGRMVMGAPTPSYGSGAAVRRSRRFVRELLYKNNSPQSAILAT